MKVHLSRAAKLLFSVQHLLVGKHSHCAMVLRGDFSFLQLVQDAEAKICIYVYDTHWVRCETWLPLCSCDPTTRPCLLTDAELLQVNQSDSSLWAADPLGRSSQPLPQVCCLCTELALCAPQQLLDEWVNVQAVEIEIPLYEVVQNRQIASNWLVSACLPSAL